MIEEVLSLGVKGDDLVLSQLQKIQEQKEKFSRPSEVSVTAATGNTAQTPGPGQKQAPQETKAQGVFKNNLDAVKGQKEALNKGFEKSQKKEAPEKETPTKPTKEKEDQEEKKKSSDSFKELAQGAITAAKSLSTLSAGSALRGAASLANLIPFYGDQIAAVGQGIITAAESFRANVESAARINLDTAESRSRIGNLVQGSGGGNFTGRVDLDLNSQRALAETLGAKFGTVQRPLQDAIQELFRDRDGRGVDVTQATQLAQGNFNALGTDKGFFLQKIADQLGSLPPSFRQSIQADLLSNISKSEQDTEDPGLRGARSTVTRFDNEQRTRASQIATPLATDQALEITNTLNRIDVSLNGGFSRMIAALERSIRERSITPLTNAATTIGRP
jgi:hypothetical protein